MKFHNNIEDIFDIIGGNRQDSINSEKYNLASEILMNLKHADIVSRNSQIIVESLSQAYQAKIRLDFLIKEQSQVLDFRLAKNR